MNAFTFLISITFLKIKKGQDYKPIGGVSKQNRMERDLLFSDCIPGLKKLMETKKEVD